MDNRDVKVEIPYIPSTGIFTVIWDKQSALLDRYIGVEKLPEYPLNLDTKEHQLIMKDLLARVVEELAESFECLKKDEIDMPGAVEELADALHFIVEAMIFTEPNRIQFLKEALEVYSPGEDELDLICEFNGDITSKPHLTPVSIIHWYWNITYYLNIARNNLRNKQWKQTQVLAQKTEFRKNLIQAFREMVMGIYLLDLDKPRLLEEYLKKNKVNHFRIDSKY